MKNNNGRDSRKYFRLLGLSAAFAALGMLSGCGGDSLSSETTETPTSSGGVKSGPVHSITISYPFLDAVVDDSNGVYRRKMSVLLRDQQGIPVPDGTVVNLRVIDSIIATGQVTGGGNTISGSTLTIPGAVQTDGSAADLTTAVVSRFGTVGGENRGIQAGDYVLLFNGANNRDVARLVSAAPQQANTLTVTQGYNSAYPETDQVGYLIGASMLSAGVAGEDEDGNLTPGRVTVLGGAGTATAWISYAANANTIHTGCTPNIDPRISPLGSGQVYVVAESGGVTTVENFCFNSIAGYTVTPFFPTLLVDLNGSISTTVCVRDGGNQIAVPLSAIGIAKASGNATAGVTVSNVIIDDVTGTAYTNLNGCFDVTFSNVVGDSSDSGVWTVIVGDGRATITVSLPEFEEEEAP